MEIYEPFGISPAGFWFCIAATLLALLFVGGVYLYARYQHRIAYRNHTPPPEYHA